MLKRRSILSCFLGVTFFVSCVGNYVPFVTKENIEKRKEKIESYNQKGKLFDYGFSGLILLCCAYFGYRLYKIEMQEREETKSRSLSNRELTRRLLRLQKQLKEDKDPDLFTGAWFKSAVKSGFTTFVSSLSAGIAYKVVERLYNKYHCFGNLQEFVTTRFGGFDCFDELLYNAQLYDNSVASVKEDIQQRKTRFIVSLRNVVAMLEDVIALMEYKIDFFDDIIVSEEDVLIPVYLFDNVNSYCKQVKSILDDSSDTQLFLVTSLFRNDIVRLIENFVGLETRIAWMFA